MPWRLQVDFLGKKGETRHYPKKGGNCRMSLNEFCNFQDMVDENIWIEKIHVHEYAHTWIGDEEMFKFIFINNFNLFPKLPSFYTLLRSLMCKKRELKFGGSSLDFGGMIRKRLQMLRKSINNDITIKFKRK